MNASVHSFWLGPLLLAGGALRVAGQGIPEPSLVMYGRVLNISSNANLRLAYGTLSCTFHPAGGGSSISVSTSLTNINNQFSYILRIPCETPVAGFPPSTNAIQLTTAGITFNRSQISWNSNLLSFAQPALADTTFFSNDRGRIERVDLTVSTPILIDPLNSLPVDWELSYFGHTGIDPFADPDGDGMNNLAEYRAGTDPNDPLSDLRFTDIRRVQNGVQLKWLSADNKTYALQRSSTLSAPFVDIQTAIPGGAPSTTYIDTTAPTLGPYFYRLRLDDTAALASGAPKFTRIQKDALGGIRLSWLSAANEIYTLQRSSLLPAGFVDVTTNVVATPPLNSLRDATATGPGPYFYRLRLVP
jgi:hypothetical protein